MSTRTGDTGTTHLPAGPAESDDDPFRGLGDVEEPVRRRHVTDRADGALGLLVLRLAVAAVLAVKGLQKVQAPDATEQMLHTAGLPWSHVLGLLLGPVQLAMAVALVLGLAVRVVGAGLAGAAVTALVLVQWSGRSDVFLPGVAGFAGDDQLLLAAVGLALLGLGGGGLGLDRRVRDRRAG